MKRVRPLILAVAAAAIAALLVPASAQANQPESPSAIAATSEISMDLYFWRYDESGIEVGTTPLDPSHPLSIDGVDVLFWQYDPGSDSYFQLDPVDDVSWSGVPGEPSWTATVPEGTYAIQFVPFRKEVTSAYWSQGAPDNVKQFWPDSTDVTVAAGESASIGTIALPYRTIWTDRVFGADRFGTAAAASMEMYPGTPQAVVRPSVVYVANGMNYPDALAAGPAAISFGAPLLLTFPTSLPTPTANELKRLHPDYVIVLGSPGAVSDAVKTAIGQAAGVSGPNLIRIGGADRYSTGNLIVRDAWLDNGSGSPVALIATGRNYPDALAAGPAAGYLGAPVILVDGNASTLAPATLQLLSDLGVEAVGVVGSSSVVSTGIENQLRGLYPGYVVRLAGASRYDTALEINEGIFGPSDYAYLSNGLNFPDALAGAPLAGWYASPLFLTPPTCLGPAADQGIWDLHVNLVTLMGSSSVLSAAVEQGIPCAGAVAGTTSAPTGKAAVTQEGLKRSLLVEAAKGGQPAKLDPSRLESLTPDAKGSKAESFTR